MTEQNNDESGVDWGLGTWKGSRRRQHQEFYALSFAEKLDRIEQMNDLAANLAASARVKETPPDR